MRISRTFLTGVILSALLLAFANSANAAGRTIWLSIFNAEDVPIRMTILTGRSNCHEPHREGARGTIRVIEPGTEYGWWINRVQGHGCDGENGQFVLTLTQNKTTGTSYLPLSTTDGVARQDVCLMFSNSLGMWINERCANQYGGRLEKTRSDAYQFVTAGLTKVLKVNALPGEWDLICSGVCNRQQIATKNRDSKQTSSFSSEETAAISTELSAGVELKGFSASATVTASHSHTLGRSMSSSVRSGSSFTDHSSFIFTNDEMNKNRIQAVWQWTVPVALSTGSEKIIRSNYYTCTSSNSAPDYDPLDDRATGTCNGSLGDK